MTVLLGGVDGGEQGVIRVHAGLHPLIEPAGERMPDDVGDRAGVHVRRRTGFDRHIACEHGLDDGGIVEQRRAVPDALRTKDLDRDADLLGGLPSDAWTVRPRPARAAARNAPA